MTAGSFRRRLLLCDWFRGHAHAPSGRAHRTLFCPADDTRELRSDVTSVRRPRDALLAGDAPCTAWERFAPDRDHRSRSARARRFRRFGESAAICFPVAALFGEEYIEIGEGTIIGPHCTISAGIMPGHALGTRPVVRIGDRCLIGKSSGIVDARVDRDR